MNKYKIYKKIKIIFRNLLTIRIINLPSFLLITKEILRIKKNLIFKWY